MGGNDPTKQLEGFPPRSQALNDFSALTEGRSLFCGKPARTRISRVALREEEGHLLEFPALDGAQRESL